MFTGHYKNSLDSKGRVSIPSNFRQTLINEGFESLILTNHFDGCLYAYTPVSWQSILDTVASIPQSNRVVKAYQRVVISSAVECSLDRHGRILVPQYLRDSAKIQKDVLFAGVGTRIEIWSKEVWDRVLEESMEILSSSDTLAELGL